MSAQRNVSFRATSFLTLAALLFASATVQAQAVKTPVKPQEKTTAKTKEKAQPIDVNSATGEELMTLPGVGEVHARKIIEGRPYKTVDELTVKAGVPAATVARIKTLTVVRPLPSPVDVNTATAERLQTLPGVGPAVAKSIIAGRPYKSFNDLAKVNGLGEAKLNILRGRVEFGKAAAAPAEKVKSATPNEKADTAKPKANATVTEKALPKEKMEAKAKTKAKETAKAKLPPGQKININTASATELDELFGIGPVRAQAIIAGRPYAKPEDIMKVKGIKEGEFAKIKDQIVVK
ncbi:MAG: helix-hairpin-helix protein [Planctomycetota bacterium]|nr:helix-hairpin-helix protein [Planctomycetota bacterium]